MSTHQILIVEDDVLVASDVESTLIEAGFGVAGVAQNYQQAIQIAEKKRVHLALIDVGLGNGDPDGVTTAEALLKRWPMVLIYLTGNTDDETFERAKATQPTAFLSKPFRPRELVQQVKLAISQENHITASTDTKPLFWPTKSGYVRIEPADIYYLEGMGNFTAAHLVPQAARRILPKGGKQLALTGNLGYWAKDLPAHTFFRLNKSVLLNMDYVERIETHCVHLGQCQILLTNSSRQTLMEQLRVVRTR